MGNMNLFKAFKRDAMKQFYFSSRTLIYVLAIIEGLYYPVSKGSDNLKNKWTSFGEFSLKRFRAAFI